MFWLRVFAVWLSLMAAETLHGVARAIVLVPYFGDFQSRQIGVFTGSLLIVALVCLFDRWLGAKTLVARLLVGLIWLLLTLLFEFGLGHFVLGYSYERLAEDYNLLEGGLMPLGLVVLLCAPLIAAKLRRLSRGVVWNTRQKPAQT
jgi:hypothetical protein